MAEVLNFKIPDMGLYQTVSFDGDRPSWYETHLRTAEELAEISSGREPTDFQVVDGLLMATPALGSVGMCAAPHRYEFQVSLVDLLRWLVEQDALIVLGDGSEFKATSMRVSNSTMTVNAPYLRDGEWRSFNFMCVRDFSIVGSEFSFVVPIEAPDRFRLGEGEQVSLGGAKRWKYAYCGQLLVVPMVKDSYLLSKAMLHYLAVRADLFMKVRSVLKIVEKQIYPLAATSASSEGRQYPRMSKAGVSLKKDGGGTSNYALVFDNYYRRYLKDSAMTYEEVLADLKQRDSAQWEKVAKNLLTDMFFKYKQPEDRVQYLSGMLRILAVKELMLRLALYEHRAYVYVNDVPFLEDSIEVPLDRLFLYGGTSRDCYILKKE